MWISKQTIRKSEEPALQSGRVTLNADGDIEAVSDGKARSIKVYAPFGYAFSLPYGNELLLSRSAGEQVCLGTEMEAGAVAPGEIRIASAFGSFIHLKSDGSVVINGLKINKEGTIE